MRTLITGGTGFIGKRLLRKLLAQGQPVRALVRTPSKLAEFADDPNLEIFQADIEDSSKLPQALGGVSRVYHMAAVVSEWVSDWSIFQRVNIDAHENLLKAAADAGVEKVVHTSSFMAIGHTDGPDIADETQPHPENHFHNPYEVTKTKAAEISARMAGEGLPIVMVVPGVVFGPGEMTEGNLVAGILKDWGAGKFPGIPGTGDKPWTYSYVEDVVNGHMLAMEKGRPGERYILGGENVTMNDLFRKASDLTGIKPPKLHIPLAPLMFTAKIMAALAKVLRFKPMLVPGTLGVMEHNWAYDSTKAISELGYEITPFDDALQTTIDWMIEQGLLSKRGG